MAIGFGVLRLEPKAFWTMTIKEMAAAIRWQTGAVASELPPSRADVAGLMQRFPDR